MPRENEREFISIIYNKKNDSPKYIELNKSKLLLFVVGLPTLTLIALALGVIGLVHTSPFHLIDTYRQNSLAREAVSKTNELVAQLQKAEDEKTSMSKKLAEMDTELKKAQDEVLMATGDVAREKAPAIIEKPLEKTADKTAGDKCPKAPVCPTDTTASVVNTIGLSTLSFFRPVQGQKDRTRPATLTLSGFKVETKRDTINLLFNIIPATLGEGKLAGHIVAIMKNELGIQVYPQSALNVQGTQISFTSGEPFATQRFRPVDAAFLRPRKAGNYTFNVYIFAKNGDLLHYQSVILPVKL